MQKNERSFLSALYLGRMDVDHTFFLFRDMLVSNNANFCQGVEERHMWMSVKQELSGRVLL